MSTHNTNISTITRITAPSLATLLLSPATAPTTAIIDVRDDDHIGGHITSSIHAPSSSLDHRIPVLVRTLAEKKVVVFHCSLSQQRGPGAAVRYLAERARRGGLVDGEGEGKGEGQEVYVLDKGFVGWQAEYGRDERLTEGYKEEVWGEYD